MSEEDEIRKFGDEIRKFGDTVHLTRDSVELGKLKILTELTAQVAHLNETLTAMHAFAVRRSGSLYETALLAAAPRATKVGWRENE